MHYTVEVVIEHDEDHYDSYTETFDSLSEARKFVNNVDDGDSGDKVKIYIDGALWREYTA